MNSRSDASPEKDVENSTPEPGEKEEQTSSGGEESLQDAGLPPALLTGRMAQFTLGCLFFVLLALGGYTIWANPTMMEGTEISPGDDGWSVVFPGTPEQTRRTLSTSAGKYTLRSYEYTTDREAGGEPEVFRVGFLDRIPEVETRNFLPWYLPDDDLRVPSTRGSDREIIHENVRVNGREGKQHTWHLPDRNEHLILLEVETGRRMYFVYTRTPSDLESVKKGERFLRSFSLDRD